MRFTLTHVAALRTRRIIDITLVAYVLPYLVLIVRGDLSISAFKKIGVW